MRNEPARFVSRSSPESPQISNKCVYTMYFKFLSSENINLKRQILYKILTDLIITIGIEFAANIYEVKK